MPHRCLDDVQAIEHLIDILQADVLLRFSEQRAFVFALRITTDIDRGGVLAQSCKNDLQRGIAIVDGGNVFRREHGPPAWR